jgi:hypothetical protein
MLRRGYKFDLDRYQLREIKNSLKAAKVPDIAALSRIMAKVVKAWPHKASPRNISSYTDLTPEQWDELFTEYVKAVRSYLD